MQYRHGLNYNANIRFFCRGQALHIDSMPLYSRLAGGPDTTPEAASLPLHGGASPPDNIIPPGFADAPAIRHANQGISTAMLGSVLGMTVAVATGIIIANNNAFKLKISPDTQSGERLAEATTTAPAPAHARPVQATPAPAVPSLSISRVEIQREVRKQHVQSGNKADGSKVAGRKEKPQPGRTIRPNPPAALARATPNRTRQKPHSAASQVEQVRPSSIQNLAAQYARCSQLQGFLRRERCKWEVCGDKWGKQGCPAYKHNTTPEIGVRSLYRGIATDALADS